MVSARLHAPDFERPVDVAAHLASLPPNATSKGMFFTALLERGAPAVSREALLARAGLAPQRYVPFGDYSMADNMRLTVALAGVLYPRLSLGQGLRTLGATAFDTFLGSHLGRVLLGALDPDPATILRLAPRVYRALFNFGRMEVQQLEPRRVRVTVADLPIFVETFQVGSVEGMFRHTRHEGEVALALDSLGSGQLELRWK